MISLSNVTKLYGQVIGVNDVTVELDAGAHGLLGPNGAGKTTLLGLVTGQLRPTMGRVLVFGREPFGDARTLRRIGWSPATELGEARVTARQWVTHLARLSGYRGAAAGRRADDVLGQVGLDADAVRPLGTLSKGLRQRAKLAGAVVHDPDLLVLDEPFVGLDPESRRELVGLVRRWALDRSLLVASHLLHEIEAIDAGLAVILGGRLVASGDAPEIRRLVEEIPGEIRVRCDRPRVLAARLLADAAADSVRVDVDTVVVGSRRPREVAAGVAAAIAAEGIVVRELASGDRSLEGLFDRLVRLHRGMAS